MKEISKYDGLMDRQITKVLCILTDPQTSNFRLKPEPSDLTSTFRLSYTINL